MNKTRNYSYITRKITKTILLSILAVGVVGTVITLPGLSVLGRQFIGWKKYNHSRLKTALKRLHRQRMINFSEKPDGTIKLELVEEGYRRVLKYKFEEMKIKIPQKWDGLWRIVIFDIPDDKKQAREALRIKLKTLGFYKFQKSVFVHPYDCKNEIDFIKEFFNISPFVKFIIAGEVDDNFKLQKIFSLR